jgi:hypothetical protein
VLAIVELGEEGPPELLQDTVSRPEFETVMDRALAPISRGQLFPLRARPQDPKDAFEALAIVGGRPATFGLALANRKFLLDQLPLPIREFPPCHRPILLASESLAGRKYL